MFRTILVPLDGSKLAEESLDRVRDLARTHRSKVILLRVAFALVFPGADATDAQIRVTEEAIGYLGKIQKRLEAEGIKAETAVRYGFPAEEILVHVNRGGIDLIVISTHGRKGISHTLLGSVVEKIVRSSPVPVLTLNEATMTSTV